MNTQLTQELVAGFGARFPRRRVLDLGVLNDPGGFGQAAMLILRVQRRCIEQRMRRGPGGSSHAVFFRQMLALADEEQMAHLRDPRVPRRRTILSDLKVALVPVRFSHLQASFHGPAAEAHMHDHFR